MESGPGSARVISFPIRVKSCWECQYHADMVYDGGVSSHCVLFGEPIAWEGQAQSCEAYEEEEK